MAKSVAKKGSVQTPVVPNLFGGAAEKASSKPKKEPGTKLVLPVQLDSEGVLIGEYAKLHAAVHDVIEAKEEEDAAKNRCDLAKGALRDFVETSYAERMAKSGALPTTPVMIVNHQGESLTYVVQDKTSSVGLSQEQLAALEMLLGADKVAEITVKQVSYAFNADVMQEIAGEIPVGADADTLAARPKVHEVVARRVSGALAEARAAGEISDEQMLNLIQACPKTVMRKGEFANLVVHTGADVSRIRGVLDAVKGAVVRYLKA